MPLTTPGSFVENPLISSIGSALGLSPLMGGGPPSAQPTPAKSELPKPAVPDNRAVQTRETMALRERYPAAKVPSTRGSSPGVGGMGMNLPGVMDPAVLQHPVVQQLLGQYGVTPEQIQDTIKGASPNLFLTNPDAYAHHPVISNLIERGLEGAAFTKTGQSTGENISNVAQGLLNAQGARADKYNNQLMMPFAQAGQVQALQAASQEQKLKEAQAAYDQSHAQYWDMLGDLRPQMEADKVTQEKAANDLKRRVDVRDYFDAHKNVALLPEEQKALDDAAQKYNGESNIPMEEIQGIYNPAIQRAIDAAEAGKNKRAGMMAGTRLRIAGQTGAHDAAKLSAEDLRHEITRLNNNYQLFQRTYGSTRDGRDVNGNYVRGTAAKNAGPEYLARLKELQDQLDAVPATMSSAPGYIPNVSVSTRGAGGGGAPLINVAPTINNAPPQPKAKRNKTYDPITQTFK